MLSLGEIALVLAVTDRASLRRAVTPEDAP
jgi:hypothetical protein